MTIDARGSLTSFDFTDRYGTRDSEARSHIAPAELGGQVSYALPTSVTNALGQTIHAQYDYDVGRVVNGEDANGVVTSVSYNDALDRPTQVVKAINTAIKSQSSFSYDDTLRIITTTSDENTYGDNLLKGEVVYDGLGRTTETHQYETASAYITTTQRYDAVGRVSQTSNPSRAGEALLLTTTEYDALGRVTRVSTPDGAAVTSAYSGNQVTVVDQAGKARQSVTDALGRLTSVVEDPTGLAYQTTYGYDALDNLESVTQGVQTRSFTYDSLKRLISASNPESGTISYQYDENGNLTHKTDARGVSTTNVYDALNRATSRSYSDATPAVTYTYDGAGVANSKGRLTSVSSSVSATHYTGYDALGRVTANEQVTDSQTYSLSYGYNLAGAMTTETYPSGRTVSTSYDGGGRINSLSGQQSGESNKTYASQIGYAAHGAISAMQLGNNLWEHASFNNRLQPTEIGLGTSSTDSSRLELDYDYGTTNNNGNVVSQTITVAGGPTLSQSYTYDPLNRLDTARETNAGGPTWQQRFTYDQYGNRRFNPSETTQNVLGANPSISTTTNRIAESGYSYDDGGNLLNDPQHSYTYDGENRLQTNDGGAQANSGVAATYSYDGDGRRVRKAVGLTTTIFVYDAMGQLVAEYGGQTGSGGTSYVTQDHLGSTRIVTGSDGEVKSRHDYLPFGEEITAGAGGRTTSQGYVVDNVRQRFTGKERDIETGLDYFGARYYANVQGRFTSPDPIYFQKEMLGDPQRFNLYIYVRNNPLKLIDPTGMIARISVNGNPNQVMWYFLTLAGGFADRITFDPVKDENGTILYYNVSFNVADADIGNNEGARLVADLVNSDKVFLAQAGGEVNQKLMGGKNAGKSEKIIVNESGGGNVTRNRPGGYYEPDDKGIDSIIYVPEQATRINQITGGDVEPISTFIHEAAESLLLAQGVPYPEAHGLFISLGQPATKNTINKFNCDNAITREAIIRKQLNLTGGPAGFSRDEHIKDQLKKP